MTQLRINESQDTVVTGRRACVSSPDGTRTYCVIVKDRLPLARSVSFDGYEPNSVFAEGVG